MLEKGSSAVYKAYHHDDVQRTDQLYSLHIIFAVSYEIWGSAFLL